jgi:single-strand DNA-binding protein
MNEPTVTMSGNVAQDVRHVTTDQGVPITSFRLASTRRQYDRAAGRWVDGETTFVNVTCWRALADHVRASISKGDPVVVIGRLRVRAWEREGYKGNAVEIDAYTVGHDLTRGTSAFRRAQARPAVAPPEREVADDLLMSMEASAAEPAALPAAQHAALPSAAGGSVPGKVSEPGPEAVPETSSPVSPTRQHAAA